MNQSANGRDGVDGVGVVTVSQDVAETLASLGEEEQKLDQRLEQARHEAKAIVADAHEQAKRRRKRAEAELVDEVQLLRQEHGRELERALGAIREETARRVEAIRRRAELNRERALAWLLSRVAGGDAS